MKKYKAVVPEETIAKIGNILNKYHIPYKESIKGDGDLFCSYRLSITNNDDFSIGTNGKGMSPIYAKASAFAEMMERFQNRVLIYPNPANHDKPYTFFPDEKKNNIHKNDIERLTRQFTPRAFPKVGVNVDDFDCVFLPFVHVNSQKIEDVPYSLIRWVNGSNGMCAGNVVEEGLIQGFNEIFERYCLQEIYLREVTPPDIPESFFEGTRIIEHLKRVRTEYGFDYRIKDCSLGEGLPVIGLVMYNPDKSKYIVQFGADLSLRIALERCYTEFFQGHTANDIAFDNELNDSAQLELFNEFKRSIVYGRGRMPQAFFHETPSYSFDPGCHICAGSDFKEDLSNIISWLIDREYDIYIRDNSFLGFPTYHIFIPGMSDISREFCNLNDRIFEMGLTDQKICPIYRIPLLKEDELIGAIRILEMKDKDAICLFPHNKNKRNNVNRLLILMLLYFRMGNDNKAEYYLNLYLSKKTAAHQQVPEYYRVMESLFAGNPLPNEMENKLEWQTALNFMNNREQALLSCDLPTCYDCNLCPLQDGCRYSLLFDVEEKARNAMEKSRLSQYELLKLFKD